MGNLCGKQSKDAFDGPGRTLGSAPAPATKASVPATANAGSSAKRTVGGPPRKLGESNAVEDPRSAAAAAAEARANKTSTGDLQRKLDAQKKQTRAGVLKEISDRERRDRQIQQKAEELTHN
ncbi:uncharacterized protein EKO05_0001707 [Ascochyta rabiei]|uniref:uncharacterized protein n=1 Tax=Didymella rabiei TaxID=5454 RepID=UPI0019025FFF|nr:uncharacterized protein EKO05_0001707 [Ascochyta rabiei]UPX11083.1 hypothetical protein EKO05_0001707 [Ascochyta rabiei]